MMETDKTLHHQLERALEVGSVTFEEKYTTYGPGTWTAPQLLTRPQAEDLLDGDPFRDQVRLTYPDGHRVTLSL